VNYPDQVAGLRAHLASRKFDMLIVNAGVKNDDRETIADVSTDEFIRVMISNALSTMRVVEVLQDLVLPSGTIGIMSSGQGNALPDLESKRFGAMADPRCDGRVNFCGMWGHVRPRRDTSVCQVQGLSRSVVGVRSANKRHLTVQYATGKRPLKLPVQ
jgi:NAD(P)-dependent dehydrogenase (short-subunit alcohol dehydrogenase family)